MSDMSATIIKPFSSSTTNHASNPMFIPKNDKASTFLKNKMTFRLREASSHLHSAELMLHQLELAYAQIKHHMEHYLFDPVKYASTSYYMHPYVDVKNGLEQITNLSCIFSDMIAYPLLVNTSTLNSFNALITESVRKNTPAYVYKFGTIMANFQLPRSCFYPSQVGYNHSFITMFERSLINTRMLIKTMRRHLLSLSNLQNRILSQVTTSCQHWHTQDQYKLCCSVYNSIISKACFDYLYAAYGIVHHIASFHTL